MATILGSGAEGYVERTDGSVRKVRPAKRYRHPELDVRLRRSRTRREAKVLQKLPVPGPRFLGVDDQEMIVEMELLDGPQLRDVLDEENADRYGRALGALVRRLHDTGIVHGDLTTSNVLVVDGALHLVDFGLSFFSESLEDRAVDLHLLMHALHAKHPDLPVWEHVQGAYAPSEALAERFAAVERRGRYKRKGS